MDYFELAKAIVREDVYRRRHGHLRTGEESRLPQTHLSLLLRTLRPWEPRVSGDDGVPRLL